jgi:hypothetical protein
MRPYKPSAARNRPSEATLEAIQAASRWGSNPIAVASSSVLVWITGSIGSNATTARRRSATLDRSGVRLT